MAVRSNGTSTQHIAQEAGTSPSSGAMTICQWNMLVAIPGADRVMMHYNDNNGATPDWIALIVGASGVVDLATIINGVPSTEDSAIHTMTEDVWYFHALVRNGSTVNCYMGTETTAVSLIGSVTNASLGAQSIEWRWIPTGVGGANLSPDHALERVKMYNAVLSESEIEAERVSLTPSSTTDLWGYVAFDSYSTGTWTTSQGDGSPYDFNISGGTGFSTVTGPSPQAVGGAAGPLATYARIYRGMRVA